MERYVVRHEYFGGLVYDRQEDTNILIDEDFYQTLDCLIKIKHNQINMFVDEEDIKFLEEEQFLDNNNLNYRLIDSGCLADTLSAPGRVHFYYTSSCNLNCTHCFSKNTTTAPEMTFEDRICMLDQMYELGINEILIGGGEPFLRRDFPDFVEACLTRNIVTKVFSNGLLLNDEKLIKRMAKWNLKYLSISIDGADEREYQKVRGIEGLTIIKSNVKMLKEYCSFTIAASITINPYNYQNAEKLLALIDDFGFDRLKVRPVKPAGNVMKNRDIFLTAEQYIYFIKEAQTIWNKKYCNRYAIDFSWGDTRLVYNAYDNTVIPLDIIYPYEGYGCFAGKVNIVFDSAGNSLTCGFLPDELAKSDSDNLREKSIKEIWESGQKFSCLRRIEGNQACFQCDYYGICRGGCMARNLFLGIDINHPDPWCIKKFFPINL